MLPFQRLLVPGLLVLLLPGLVSARPPYRKALADLLDLPAASRLNDCRACHEPAKAGEAQPGGSAPDADRPHNPFGARLARAREELRKAGKPFDLVARLKHVANDDSDGDGVPNLVELLAGHNPGEKEDRPGATRAAQARDRQAAWLASLDGYRWRPFDRVERPPVPATSRPGLGGANPIDRFVEARMVRDGILPRPEAPRHVLVRRLFLDLTGLPPTPEDVLAFEEDLAPGAYERLVERLLATPTYGERWGRHWMDVWRYSDWAGFGAQVRDSQPHIWHWRDWIVESLNADVGYDRMVQLMLAADELAPEDPQALRATGFLVRNYKLLSREKWLQDVVDHTGQAFLGLTLGCAKCHDHMYDPVTQKEYYQFRAVFMPHNVRTDRLPGHPDLQAAGLPRAYDADPNAPTFLLIRGDDRTPDKTPVAPGVPEALGGSFGTPEPIKLPPHAVAPDRRPFVLAELIDTLARAVDIHDRDVATAEWRSRLAPVTAGLAGRPLNAASSLGLIPWLDHRHQGAARDREVALEVVRSHQFLADLERLEDAGRSKTPEWERAAQARVASERKLAWLRARNRALAVRHGLVAPDGKDKRPFADQLAQAEKELTTTAAALAAPPSTAYTPRKLTSYPATSSGRRLALARWITARDNPLAARVAVNHVWARHFGRGIVPTTGDLGRNGQAPTHPELLDWLAEEFMASGWSQKHLHRLIVSSDTYRRSSTPDGPALARDPDNISLWRFSPRRAEAEVVRDALLAVGGRLDGTLGGPDLDHALGLTSPRRSLYFRHAAEKQMEFLTLFDAASVTECYERKSSIIPQQALALFNSDLAARQARLLARDLSSRTGPDSAAFVDRAFLAALSRRPTGEERSECLAYLANRGGPGQAGGMSVGDGTSPAADLSQRARETLILVLLNHHEFVTLR